MEKMHCFNCGTTTYGSIDVCPVCEKKIIENNKFKNFFFAQLIIYFLIALLILAYYGKKEKTNISPKTETNKLSNKPKSPVQKPEQ